MMNFILLFGPQAVGKLANKTAILEDSCFICVIINYKLLSV